MLVSRGLHMYILRKQYLSIPSQNCAGLPTTRRSEYQETIELILGVVEPAQGVLCTDLTWMK